MLLQLYRKNGVWRLANVAQGFNGGLVAIVQHFGGDVADGISEEALYENMLEEFPSWLK